MRIKGRYVATVIFDFDYDVENKDIKSFPEIQSNVKSGKLSDEIKKSLLDWIFDDSMGNLTVEQQYADLYKVEE